MLKLTSANKKIVITSLVLAAAILVLAWLTFFWETERVKRASEDYQKEKLNSFVVQEKKDRLAKLSKDTADIKAATGKLAGMFVGKNAALPLLRGFEDAARESSCEITMEPVDISKIKFATAPSQSQPADTADDSSTTVKSDQPSSASSKQTKPDELAALKNYPAFSLSVTGSYGAAVDFLNKMENLPYFVRPLMVDVVPAEKSKQASGSGALQTASAAGSGQEVAAAENNNIVMTLVIVAYGN